MATTNAISAEVLIAFACTVGSSKPVATIVVTANSQPYHLCPMAFSI